MSTNVGIVNASTLVTDDQVTPVVAALRTQVTRHFAPAWGRSAILHQIAHGHAAPKAAWQLILLDDSDQADALGYHDLTQEGLPLGKVFLRADQQAGASWSVTASHELLEMLADPWISLAAQTDDSTLYAVEVGDPCEADQFGYQVDGVLLSDFVLPAWFEPGIAGSHKLDYCGRISTPLALLPGGYCSTLHLGKGGGWQQQYAEHDARSFRMRPHVGSRRERRRTPRADWLRSTA